MVVIIEAMARAAPRERTNLNSYTPCPPEATRRKGELTLRLNINSTQSQNITNSSQTRAMVFCVMLAAAMSLTLISATS